MRIFQIQRCCLSSSLCDCMYKSGNVLHQQKWQQYSSAVVAAHMFCQNPAFAGVVWVCSCCFSFVHIMCVHKCSRMQMSCTTGSAARRMLQWLISSRLHTFRMHMHCMAAHTVGKHTSGRGGWVSGPGSHQQCRASATGAVHQQQQQQQHSGAVPATAAAAAANGNAGIWAAAETGLVVAQLVSVTAGSCGAWCSVTAAGSAQQPTNRLQHRKQAYLHQASHAHTVRCWSYCSGSEYCRGAALA